MDDMMAHSIRYHFEFSIDEHIEYLTVSQNFGGEEPAVPSEMDVRVFHHGVLMERALLSHRTAHTVRLDWEAGWEQAADDLEGARERLRQRREDALGITSYSRVYSYAYITDTEIRHEILIPFNPRPRLAKNTRGLCSRNCNGTSTGLLNTATKSASTMPSPTSRPEILIPPIKSASSGYSSRKPANAVPPW